MVSASSNGHRKKHKKVKKCSKRTPVNLQPNFNRDTACGDFHLHSLCSDGKLKPSEVITKAAANGVTYMALTDHDTMAGVSEAISAAQELGVLVIPGVEISAEVKGGENLHILGYFHPGSNSLELEKQLLKIRTGRHKRGKGMLKKLESMGIRLEWERVLEIAGEAAPGRPHVAEALVEAGHVSNFRQAFARYLHNDGPAYVEGEHFPPDEAIKLIASAGGISVLAHPWCCKDPMTLVPKLAKMGIQGIEVYHDTNKIEMYGNLAKESGLLMLGGSDFHGIEPTTERAPGAIPFPRLHVDRFLAHAQKIWERPLVKQLQSMVKAMKMADHETSTSEQLLIWREQMPVVHQTLAEFGMGVEQVEIKDTLAKENPETESHYCRFRIIDFNR
ncbi:php domain n-terminal region:php domain c-terminal region [Plasmopara halstedii]|uniref:Php domain n-terminal region:php domain c-terminal region n=1 Tax=Plasmopara halstedii TaxID=4781 RepID=A0A0P1AXT2_PLAHL|nr:php domain n-terminal region:php domain c-terminal region [Plasmopara halstedii]CEG46015.1 php domain n-terminal region:php domain c-terminal region [Plasmopara halstedii]|eukprot:XP_024582384.1 php domain n-terminal region:php domain c-terminal region [Plasmopara halstedii]